MKLAAYISFFVILCTSLIADKSAASWNFMFSNKQYQENITVNAYLVNKDQVCDSLTSTSEQLQPLAHKDLSPDHLNLIIRLKNRGDLAAWGTINININDRKSYEVNIHSLPANMTDFLEYVVPISGLIVNKSEQEMVPNIKISWVKLYSK